MPYTPTPEQEACITAAKTTQANLLISALAGAAKTSTLVLMANALQGKPILSLAFNKRIAEEMKTRLPPWCECLTLNSLGHRVWSKAIGKSRMIVDTEKGAKLLKEYIAAIKNQTKKDIFHDAYGELLKLYRLAKSAGYIPATHSNHSKSLTPDFFEIQDEEIPLEFKLCIDSMLNSSIKQAYGAIIDYDDQLYMPTLFGGTFPSYPIIMVDEAQDLSPLNHEMINKLVGTRNRIIAVGDPNQAIYGFRGAQASGMESMEERFNMTRLPLTISFRCPKEVIRNVHWLVPDMSWPSWAEEGLVRTHHTWDTSTIPDGAAVICRNNSPLFWLAFQLIKQGRGVKLIGADIGPQLVRVLKKFGDENTPQKVVFEKIEEWVKEQSKRVKSKTTLEDKAECLRIFASQGNTLYQIIFYAEKVLKQDGPIELMSGHKAKGLEYDIVFHLDPFRCRPREGENDQENNVKYVIDTRAKKELHYIIKEEFA